MYRIALRVAGVNLDDPSALVNLGDLLAEVAWTSTDGRVTVEFYTSLNNPVGHAVQVARQIECSVPGVSGFEVDPDLVGISDIATRVGVTRQAVQNWVDGKRGPGDFPAPTGSIGGGDRSIRIWSWFDVNEWLKQLGLDDEDELLSPRQVAELNASLRKVAAHDEWDRKVAAGVSDLPLPVVPPGEGPTDGRGGKSVRAGQGRIGEVAQKLIVHSGSRTGAHQ